MIAAEFPQASHEHGPPEPRVTPERLDGIKSVQMVLALAVNNSICGHVVDQSVVIKPYNTRKQIAYTRKCWKLRD